MKREAEVLAAHDVFTQILEREMCSPLDRPLMLAARVLLCWVLDHQGEGPEVISRMLSQFRRDLEHLGWVPTHTVQ